MPALDAGIHVFGNTVFYNVAKAWMAVSSTAMTALGLIRLILNRYGETLRTAKQRVLAIHVFRSTSFYNVAKTWMAVSSMAMTG
jgi:hypothetical protein